VIIFKCKHILITLLVRESEFTLGNVASGLYGTGDILKLFGVILFTTQTLIKSNNLIRFDQKYLMKEMKQLLLIFA
jgi:hypothetical protein